MVRAGLVALVALLVAGGAGIPDGPGGASRATLDVRAARGIPAGGSGSAGLIVTVRPGWHINSSAPSDSNLIPTSAACRPPAGLRVTGLRFPPAVTKKLAFADTPLDVYEGTVVVDLEISAADSLAPGNYGIPAEVAYQACNDEVCMPPDTLRAVIPVQVVRAAEHVH
jgi:DsbC/DsbD-like thiol-disulfide interchange protein